MSKKSFVPPEPIYVLTKDAVRFLAEHKADLPPGIVSGRRNVQPEGKLCNMPNRKGGKCNNYAGFKTFHVGQGPCFRHDGHGKYGRQLMLDFVEQERLMGVYGDPINIDPHTALLKEVQRTAGHVEWLRQLVDDIHDRADKKDNKVDIALVQYTPLGIQPSVWIQMYNEERRHLVRVCESAIKAGVAERTVQIQMDQARMLAMVLKSFLLDNRMSFTPEQRIAAPAIIREIISSSPNAMDVHFPDDAPLVIEATAATKTKTKGKKS